MNTLKHFVIWIAERSRQVTTRTILSFIDQLWISALSAKTINCYLDGIRWFLRLSDPRRECSNRKPVKRGYVLKRARPLPRYFAG